MTPPSPPDPGEALLAEVRAARAWRDALAALADLQATPAAARLSQGPLQFAGELAEAVSTADAARAAYDACRVAATVRPGASAGEI